MSRTLVREKLRVRWTNGTGSDVTAGTCVLFGTRPAVAMEDIANNAEGLVILEGVHRLAKETGLAITAGAKVYRDATTGEINPTASGNDYAGIAAAAAASGDTLVDVVLGYGSNAAETP